MRLIRRITLKDIVIYIYMTSIEKQKRFVEGLKELGLDVDDVKNWKCIGCDNQDNSNNDPHDPIRYLMWIKWCDKNNRDYRREPEQTWQCVCNNKIKYNYWATPNDKREGKNIITIGSCCMTHFLEDGKKKHCIKCNKVNTRRLSDICFDCTNEINAKQKQLKEDNKKKICKCGKYKKEEFPLCFECNKNKPVSNTKTKKCAGCSEMINYKFKLCYHCNKESKIECYACRDTGVAYLCDGVFGGCIECGKDDGVSYCE